ncbi:mannose-6-phosphate isomerase type 1 [Chitinophaga skermanii]|uniref:mannose-6-phosphate isomerase n=1 Tax=Chitinophaga skermanii TaxID=331697 RepID=A0A327QR01_9BACT|nr:mannose-6-phosphate isomerase, class I [Chitinophaga skermanii]RAJ06671.1 mannose-6-phosphate isomerase type 1 [Chitinophaga skermanii]
MSTGTLNKKLFHLTGKVQHYAWGGYSYIPALLGLPVTNEPSAEYWMGAHQSAPSQIGTTPNPTPLNDLVAANPSAVLGEQTFNTFGELPYLLKILDVKDMLSIQVHPTKAEAEKGFARENEEGIALNAPNRNYKDANHKPEIMVALSEFYLLHGFLPADKLKEVINNTPAFLPLAHIFEQEGYYGMYKFVMELPQEDVNSMLRPLVDEIVPLYKENKLAKTDPAFWAARAVVNDPQGETRLDRGIFSIYFFNIMHVQEGEAVFQDAGIPHAYLEGQNVELMANSDNVLRGGLTPKHIDVPELLKHTRFEAVHPQIITASIDPNTKEAIYQSPAPDFVVSKIELQTGEVYSHKSNAAEILIVMEGAVQANGSDAFDVKKGESIFVAYNEAYTLSQTGNSKAVLFKATVPVK